MPGIGITSFQPWNVNGDPKLSRGDRGFSNSATDTNFWLQHEERRWQRDLHGPALGTVRQPD